ncbi:MAG: glycoside hydrolase family 65 [Lachnospiraceae bacterium]|nr:glycoside hydrolase family 65 [Lachnospiraceae bacterium]
MINREELIKKHNPILTAIETNSPLTIGNGEFAFTCDITGLQTLYHEYQLFPLCTMSEWGWATKPNALGKAYAFDDVEKTCYHKNGRTYEYAVNCFEGNEEAYHWLRHNPHRRNLARVGLLWDGRKISGAEITNIRQELDLYTGILFSHFTLNGFLIKIKTCCAKTADVLGVSVSSNAPAGRLSVMVSLPESSHRKNASDWTKAKHYLTREISKINNGCYSINLSGSEFEFALAFSPDNDNTKNRGEDSFAKVRFDSINGWAAFWQKGGMADFSKCKDPRANELERQMILSQYLIAVQCTGNQPPQETGLSINSWYGKFHLEMHIIHSGWLALFGHADLLEKSFAWYFSILANARLNARQNGYKGARWPKMVGPEGIDSPSYISTLLIWQQPHLLYLLELTKSVNNDVPAFMRKYWLLVRETADFMVDFLHFNKETGHYELSGPLIPAQEEHAPENVLNPVFELCYWHFGLRIAIRWAEELGEDCALWQEVRGKLANPPIIDDLYPAHANCPDTFTSFNRDHPSMLYGFGFIPCDLIDKDIMLRTADLALEVWDQKSLWGWDFAFIAMTYARLGCPDKAIEILLTETDKNSYAISGNNLQRGRDDLPLYLPGNGAKLFALSMMLKGYGETKGCCGFPDNGLWDGILVEGITGLLE